MRHPARGLKRLLAHRTGWADTRTVAKDGCMLVLFRSRLTPGLVVLCRPKMIMTGLTKVEMSS